MKKERFIHITVPSKIHLLGEHSVVYGKPALLTAVGLYTYIRLKPLAGDTIRLTTDFIGKPNQFSYSWIMKKTAESRGLWAKFQRANDPVILKSIISNPSDFVCLCIGESLLVYGVTHPIGFEIVISTDVPIGAGLGSSAAVAAGIAAAIGHFVKGSSDRKIYNDIAFACEKFQHGNPSGSDPAAVIFGGFLWYRKETADIRLITPLAFALPESAASDILLFNTGIPVESTGDMIASVRSNYSRDPDMVKDIMDNQEDLVRLLSEQLKSKGSVNKIMDIIRKGEQNLELLGVVSPSVVQFIREIENVGGAAKICGAGGLLKGSGMVLAIHPQKQRLTEIAKKYSYPEFDVRIGVDGLSVHRTHT